MRAFQFTADLSDPSQVNLQIVPGSDASSLRMSDNPLVFVVTDSDLATFREVSGTIDCGGRHPKRPLKSYLLGKREVPLLAAKDYDYVGRLTGAIHRFIEQAIKAGETNAYAIGVREDLFEDLLETWPVETDAMQGSGDWASANVLAREADGDRDFDKLLRMQLIGDSQHMEALRKDIERVAQRSGAAILIHGESGTGKELVARLIHDCGPQGDESFVAVNMAAIPRERLEAELFGWKKGAFPYAYADKPGLWALARNGTLFLDEMGYLPLDLQAKILRAMQEKEFYPVGATKPTPAPARVVTATKHDLAQMVNDGTFDEALYWRIAPITIKTPALRERPDDIAPIGQHIWRRLRESRYKPLGKPALDRLSSLTFPGNVRELESILIRLDVFYGDEEPDLDALEAVLRVHEGARPGIRKPKSASLAEHRAICVDHLQRVDEVVRRIKMAFRPLSESRKSWGINDLDPYSAECPEALVEMSLVQCHTDLDLLCQRSLLFFDDKVFDLVYQLKGLVLYSIGLLRSDGTAAKSHYKQKLKPQTQRVHDALFTTSRELLTMS